MIIEKDTKNLDESRSLALAQSNQETSLHAPPSYDASISLSSSGRSSLNGASNPSTSSSTFLPPKLVTASRSSHINIHSNHSAVSATHIIDLNRPVPTIVLPSIINEEERATSQLIGGGSRSGDRPNAFFWSHHSSVKVTVGVEGKQGADPKERVRVVAGSQHGKVFVEMLSLPSPSPTSPLPPVSIHLSCTHSVVTLLLPRSFHGTLSHRTAHGSIKISSELQKVYTPMSNELGFVGDLGGWTGVGGEDGGLDEAKCESKHGGVRIGFEGEGEEAWGDGLYKKVVSELGAGQGGWGIRWGAKK